jgi:hypothetical protein
MFIAMSVSVNKTYSAAIIISNQTVGIDVELQREKILRIADKFVDTAELSRLQSFSTEDYIRKLTVNGAPKKPFSKYETKKALVLRTTSKSVHLS